MSKRRDIIVVICGSAASWMIDNVLNEKGGLYGRVTQQIRLQPFTLSETKQFLGDRNIRLDNKQLIEIYMAMGGVAKYLLSIQTGESSVQAINNSCFSTNGPLKSEFNNLYRSLFDNYTVHIKIIRELAKKRSGLSREELLHKLGKNSGGSISKILSELVESNFIAQIPSYGNKIRSAQYILIDEYSLFYLRWIEPVPNLAIGAIDKDYWLKKHNTQEWKVWAGYAFESICYKHIDKIKEALQIGGVSSSVYKGTQIDMIIDRNDQCINLCEIKFYNTEYAITMSYLQELETKKNKFQQHTNTKKTVFMTMISSYGVKENEHYRSIINNQLTINALF